MILLLTFLLLFSLAHLLSMRIEGWSVSIYNNFVYSFIGFCIIASLISVSLSAFQILAIQAAVTAWSSVMVLLLITNLLLLISCKNAIPFFYNPNPFRHWAAPDFVFGILLVTISIVAFLMGVLVPPNNGDSLIYHLPRQIIWISEMTIFSERMPYAHMNIMPPLMEWIGVQFYLITGTDRWHFLINFAAYLASMCLIRQLVAECNASRSTQWFAVLFFSTLPAAFYQASNTKNDLFLAFFLLALFRIACKINLSVIGQRIGAVICAILAGMAVLIKGTAVAYLPPLFIVSAFRFFASGQRVKLLSFIIIVLVFAPIAYYEYSPQLFNEGIKSDYAAASATLNKNLDASTTASVLIRNVALQMALPSHLCNEYLEKICDFLCGKIGVPAQDIDSIYTAKPSFKIDFLPFYEDNATSILHFLLPIIVAFGGFIFIKNLSQRNLTLDSVGIFILSLILFSFLFRWQPFHSRLLIPAVALASPGIGIFLGSLRRQWIAFSIVALMFIWLTPSFFSWSRPILGRLTVFEMDEHAGISRAGSGASFLPSYGKAMSNAGIANVGLDLQNGVVHAAIRFLPLSTNYDFPASASYADFGAEGLLSNLPIQQLSEDTKIKASKMERVASMEGCNLWLRPENTLRAESKVVDLPNLWGVEEVEGLGEWQGPYPQFKVRVFAKKEGVMVRLKSTRALKSARLLFDGAPEGAPIPIIITHAGINIYSGNISKKTGLIKIELGPVDEGDIFEINVPESSSFRIYSFRILNEI